jgi:hypothetical protein
VTGAAWVALVALVVSVTQAMVQLTRYFRNKAKANLSANGLLRHITTTWSIRTSREGPTRKEEIAEVVIVNHGPHKATDVIVQILDDDLKTVTHKRMADFWPFEAAMGTEHPYRAELRVLHPGQQVALELIRLESLRWPPAVRLTWRDGRLRTQQVEWLIPRRSVSEA